MEVREQRQLNPVGDHVAALIAVTRPIIAGVLHSISKEVLTSMETSRGDLKLHLLGRVRKEGDGDCGIAFEYAVHDAILREDPVAQERVATALAHCNIRKGSPSSILFAVEKSGSQQLISTASELITNESRVLSGQRGQPVKLKGQMNLLAAAFRRPSTRPALPQSIRGLWKADLFLGSTEPDHWVGTTVKINPDHLEAAHGLRVAIVPSSSGKSDAIRKNDQKNLVICPMPHDGSFMQVFYEGWRIVQILCATDFKMPKEVELPNPLHREVARAYVERRMFPVADVVEAMGNFEQPELLDTQNETVGVVNLADDAPGTSTIVTPFARWDD